MNDSLKFTELSNFFSKQNEAKEASKRFKFTLFGGSVGSGGEVGAFATQSHPFVAFPLHCSFAEQLVPQQLLFVHELHCNACTDEG